MRTADVVIVGAGRAGHALARALRRRDGACTITLISAHDAAVYPKPALAYALGLEREAAMLVQATAEMVATRERLHLLVNSSVQAIDLSERCVVLHNARIPFDRLVLATGQAMGPPPGLAAAPGLIHSINRLADYAALRARLTGAARVLILGAGSAACEFANDLAASGRQPLLIDACRHPLGERLPGLAGARFRAALAHAGVRFRLANRVLGVEPLGPRKLRATTAFGEPLEFDLAVALGEPRARTELAEAAGMRVEPAGIAVDDCLRSDVAGVFALGGCAALPESIRMASIEAQAQALAETLCGTIRPPVARPTPLRLNTPACPLVLMDPPRVAGEWHERATTAGVSASFVDRSGALRGFVLVGACAEQQDAWTRSLA